MLLCAVVLLTATFVTISAQNYEIPEPKIEALKPRGIRVSIPDEPGIELFAFHANLNKDLIGVAAGQISIDIVKPSKGRWEYYNERIRLKVGDVISYWLYVQVDGLGYQKLEQKWTVNELVDPNNGEEVKTEKPVTATEPVTQCQPSLTKVNGKTACSGDVIFTENFNSLDTTTWEYDIQIANNTDHEFVAFTSDPENCFINNGFLNLKPTLTHRKYSKDFIEEGTLNLEGCTSKEKADCSKKAQGWDIIPPVFSARIKTRSKFSFKYGRVEIQAKLPFGNWLYPELWLEPKDNSYGEYFASGRIQLAMSRGNTELILQDQPNIVLGGRHFEASCIFGVGENIHQEKKVLQSERLLWSHDFHIFSLIWTPDNITYQVNGDSIGTIYPPAGGFGSKLDLSNIDENPWKDGSSLAPFDKEFYITFGLGVGGVREFPDNCRTSAPGEGWHPKPWKNTDPKAMLHFWRDKAFWEDTWSDRNSPLVIDYVQIWAL